MSNCKERDDRRPEVNESVPTASFSAGAVGPGGRIGPCKLLSSIGEGAYGIVYLANAQILTIPEEALPNTGYYLKRKMQGSHNLLFGLTNDAFGYILKPWPEFVEGLIGFELGLFSLSGQSLIF